MELLELKENFRTPYDVHHHDFDCFHQTNLIYLFKWQSNQSLNGTISLKIEFPNF